MTVNEDDLEEKRHAYIRAIHEEVAGRLKTWTREELAEQLTEELVKKRIREQFLLAEEAGTMLRVVERGKELWKSDPTYEASHD
jgi:hypothetical protein